MSKSEIDNYLETAPIGTTAGPDSAKIDWIKCNWGHYFKNKKAHYLDIGPGQGEFLIYWKRLCLKNITSVDIARDVAQHIRKLGFVCDLITDVAKYLAKKKNQFDFIILSDVIEHIEKDRLVDFIKAVRGALKTGGRVLIKVPNAQSPHFALGRYGDITHIQSFSELSLNQLLRLGGFKNIDLKAEKIPVTISNPLGILAKYVFTPIYFAWVRLTRRGTFHFNPKILTQAIIAEAKK